MTVALALLIPLSLPVVAADPVDDVVHLVGVPEPVAERLFVNRPLPTQDVIDGDDLQGNTSVELNPYDDWRFSFSIERNPCAGEGEGVLVVDVTVAGVWTYRVHEYPIGGDRSLPDHLVSHGGDSEGPGPQMVMIPKTGIDWPQFWREMDDTYHDWVTPMDRGLESMPDTWNREIAGTRVDPNVDPPAQNLSQNRTDPANLWDCGSIHGENLDPRNLNASGLANRTRNAWIPFVCQDVRWLAGRPVPAKAVEKVRQTGLRSDEETCGLLDRTAGTVVDRLPGALWSRDGPPHGPTYGSRAQDEIPWNAPAVRDPDHGVQTSTLGRAAPHLGGSPLPELLAGPLGVALAVAVVAAAAFALYRRLRPEDVLENDLRVALLERVRDQPGVKTTTLADQMDVALTTVLYHARILAEAGHLTVKRSSGEVRFFLPDETPTILERDLLCALRRPGKRELLRLLSTHPGLNISEAARRLERNRSTVKRHADDLVERGLVVDERQGRCRTLELPGDVHRLLEGS